MNLWINEFQSQIYRSMCGKFELNVFHNTWLNFVVNLRRKEAMGYYVMSLSFYLQLCTVVQADGQICHPLSFHSSTSAILLNVCFVTFKLLLSLN